MVHAQYLVVGSSHAALEAVSAIRTHDPEGSLALVTRDSRLPYSPTVLPYVVSGRSAPDNVYLRAPDYFAGQRVTYMADSGLAQLHPERNAATLSDGIFETGRYEKVWEGNASGGRAPAGLYFVRYEWPGQSAVKRLMLVR